jgi:hypothetical protein
MAAASFYPWRFAVHGWSPACCRIQTIGHQLVKADCSKFRPANPVSASHHGECNTAKDTLAVITTPAMARNPRSIVMTLFLVPELVILKCRVRRTVWGIDPRCALLVTEEWVTEEWDVVTTRRNDYTYRNIKPNPQKKRRLP